MFFKWSRYSMPNIPCSPSRFTGPHSEHATCHHAHDIFQYLAASSKVTIQVGRRPSSSTVVNVKMRGVRLIITKLSETKPLHQWVKPLLAQKPAEAFIQIQRFGQTPWRIKSWKTGHSCEALTCIRCSSTECTWWTSGVKIWTPFLLQMFLQVRKVFCWKSKCKNQAVLQTQLTAYS